MVMAAGVAAIPFAGSAQARVEGASATCANVDPAATSAINALLASPWGPVSAQRADDAEKKLEADLEGKKFVDADGGGTLNWTIWAKTTNVNASVGLSRPPGFQRIAEDCFDVRAPLTGDWSFSLSASVPQRARVRIGGENIFSISPTASFSFRLSGNFAAHVELDRSDPTRPRLRSATLTPTFRVQVSNLFSLNASIPATVRPDGTIEFRRELVDTAIDFGSVSAKFNGDLIITLKPSGFVAGAFADLEHDIGSEVRDNPYVVGDTVNVQSAFQRAEIRLAGRLRASLKRVGTVSAPWSITMPVTIPSSGELIEVQRLIAKTGIPIRWGDTISGPNALARETRTIDFAGEARIVERGALAHLPWDTVVSLMPDARSRTTVYSGQKDVAIWSGHYLAAEAFRYAATKEPEALEHVRKALTGIERLYTVASSGATRTSATARAKRTAERGVLTRAAVPSTADRWDAGPIKNKGCWYEWPEKGWTAGGRRFATYAEVPDPLRRLAAPDTTGRVWHAWGCGSNWPVSRDQYAGVLLGVGAAWRLVDDPDVKARTQRLIDDTLAYFLRHRWTIVLPPDGRVETDFIGDFPKQLAFLRLGATVNPARWGAQYNAVAAAARHAWIPIWFSGIDPLFQYYKFNLSNAALTIALMNETAPGPRAGFLYAHELLWGNVRHHRNAYFALLHVLANGPAAALQRSALNPSLTLRDEIVAVLADWIDRRLGVPGPNQLPLDDMSPAAIAFQQSLFPRYVGRYKGIELTESWQSTSALPVDGRAATNMDFVWQRHPFNIGYPNSARTATQPTAEQVRDSGAKASHRLRESPGVDYLLPYWIAVYLGVLPKP